MKKMLVGAFAVALPLLLLSPVWGLGLRDDARIFSDQAASQVTKLITKIHDNGQDVTIQTVLTTPTDVPENAEAKKSYFENWAKSIAPRDTLFVLMTVKPQYLRVFTFGETKISPTQREHFSNILLANFRQNHFNEGIVEAVNYIDHETASHHYLLWFLAFASLITCAIAFFLKRKMEGGIIDPAILPEAKVPPSGETLYRNPDHTWRTDPANPLYSSRNEPRFYQGGNAASLATGAVLGAAAAFVAERAFSDDKKDSQTPALPYRSKEEDDAGSSSGSPDDSDSSSSGSISSGPSGEDYDSGSDGGSYDGGSSGGYTGSDSSGGDY